MFEQSVAQLRHATGIVIPIYLRPSDSAPKGDSQAVALLRDTVVAVCQVVADPSVICLSVDGAAYGSEIVSALAREYGTSHVIAPENRGKLQGVREGARKLLEREDLAYVAVLDCDNDHFANELLNFVRMGEHMATQVREGARQDTAARATPAGPDRGGGDSVAAWRTLILGRRISRHRPMGLLRGELEELADRMLLLALQYHAAVSGMPLRLEYATMLDAVPDFHSGYKLFSRATAEDVFLPEPHSMGLPDTVVYRHAVEAVMVVEALLGGARLGVVNRSTYNRQPVTSYGLLDRAALTADMIIYPCKRLGIPGTFVRQWLLDILPSLLLGTLVPQGREELKAVYHKVLDAFGQEGSVALVPDPFASQPLFL